MKKDISSQPDLLLMFKDWYTTSYPSFAEHDLAFIDNEIDRLKTLNGSGTFVEIQQNIERSGSRTLLRRNIFSQAEKKFLLDWKKELFEITERLQKQQNVSERVLDLWVLGLSKGVAISVKNGYLPCSRFTVHFAEYLLKNLPTNRADFLDDLNVNQWKGEGRNMRGFRFTGDVLDKNELKKAVYFLIEYAFKFLSKDSVLGKVDKAKVSSSISKKTKGDSNWPVWCWRLSDKTSSNFHVLFSSIALFDAYEAPMICEPVDYQIGSHKARGESGGFLTKPESKLIGAVKEQTISLKARYAHSPEFLDHVNACQKIPFYLDLETIIKTLIDFKGGSTELVLESIGKGAYLRKFFREMRSSYEKTIQTYESFPQDHEFWGLYKKRVFLIANDPKPKFNKKKREKDPYVILSKVLEKEGAPLKENILKFVKARLLYKLKSSLKKRRNVWWTAQVDKCRRIIQKLIIMAVVWPNTPLYGVLVMDHRGRMYINGEFNHINSKLFRRFVTLKIPVKPVEGTLLSGYKKKAERLLHEGLLDNRRYRSFLDGISYDKLNNPKNNPRYRFYIACQHTKLKTISSHFEETPTYDPQNVRNSLEIAKINTSLKIQIPHALGMDATSSVCQVLSILSGDEQLAIDTNVLLSPSDYKKQAESVEAKDIYTSLAHELGLKKEIPEHVKRLALKRSFIKAVIMKHLYSSKTQNISTVIYNDYSDPNCFWDKSILTLAANKVVDVFKEKYPIAWELKLAVEKYGQVAYKKNRGTVILHKNPRVDMHFSHHAPVTRKKKQKIETIDGNWTKIHVPITLWKSEKLLTKKGGSSTLVNLIHSVDARVLLLTRSECLKKDIYTLGIQDCLLCMPNCIEAVVSTYGKKLLEQSAVNLEETLPGFVYPKSVLNARHTFKTKILNPSPHCLMPT